MSTPLKDLQKLNDKHREKERNNGTKTFLYETLETETDKDGNKTEKSQSISIDKEQEPFFIKMYIDDLAFVKQNPKWMNKVLVILLKNMQYGNEIILNITIKKRYAEQLGMSLHSFSKALSRLKKSGVLLSTEKGVYIANPNLFARGRWKQVKEVRMLTRYMMDGTKEVTADFDMTDKKELPGQTKLDI